MERNSKIEVVLMVFLINLVFRLKVSDVLFVKVESDLVCEVLMDEFEI